MSPNTQNDKPTKQHITKSRLTVYLAPETESIFDRMYADKIVKGKKVDKSSMICEAVRLL